MHRVLASKNPILQVAGLVVGAVVTVGAILVGAVLISLILGLAVIAGRQAHLAGRISRRRYATASSPPDGLVTGPG